jgi:hypothetical protein
VVGVSDAERLCVVRVCARCGCSTDQTLDWAIFEVADHRKGKNQSPFIEKLGPEVVIPPKFREHMGLSERITSASNSLVGQVDDVKVTWGCFVPSNLFIMLDRRNVL